MNILFTISTLTFSQKIHTIQILVYQIFEYSLHNFNVSTINSFNVDNISWRNSTLNTLNKNRYIKYSRYTFPNFHNFYDFQQKFFRHQIYIHFPQKNNSFKLKTYSPLSSQPHTNSTIHPHTHNHTRFLACCTTAALHRSLQEIWKRLIRSTSSEGRKRSIITEGRIFPLLLLLLAQRRIAANGRKRRRARKIAEIAGTSLRDLN